MCKTFFILYFLPVLIAGEAIDTDDEDMSIVFYCGVEDSFDVIRSTLARVDPQVNMAIDGEDIVNIKNSVFEDCGETLTLSMTGNRVAYLTAKRLEGLRNLVELNLFNNVIDFVENGTFDGLKDLRDLELSYNRLNGLDLGVRSGLKELRKLHLNRNPILLREDGFLGLTKLQLLELTGANISNIPYGSFNGLDQLRRLDLSSNILTSVSESSFELLIQLEELDLSMNRISRIYKDTFTGLENLKYLWLNDNQINYLTATNIFERIPNLTKLYLQRNPLAFFNAGVFKLMRSVQIEPGFVIELAGNVKSNFFNETFSTYECGLRQSQIGSENVNSESIRQGVTTAIPFEYTEKQYHDYYAPYHCVALTADGLIKVTMI